MFGCRDMVPRLRTAPPVVTEAKFSFEKHKIFLIFFLSVFTELFWFHNSS